MRTKVISHMMSSVDGRLALSRWTKPYGNVADDALTNAYAEVAATFQADAMIVGRTSFQELVEHEDFDTKKYQPAAEHKTYVAERTTKNLAIVYDPSGRIKHLSSQLWGDNLLVVLSQKVSEEYMSHLREMNISYVFAGEDGRDLSVMLESLYTEFGIKTLMLGGGGALNGAFLKSKLIDEISVLICPCIDGLSGVSSIYEYRGDKDEKPADGQQLELIGTKPLSDGIVHVHYKVHR